MSSDHIQQHVEIPMDNPSAKISAEEGAESGIVVKTNQKKKMEGGEKGNLQKNKTYAENGKESTEGKLWQGSVRVQG